MLDRPEHGQESPLEFPEQPDIPREDIYSDPRTASILQAPFQRPESRNKVRSRRLGFCLMEALLQGIAEYLLRNKQNLRSSLVKQ